MIPPETDSLGQAISLLDRKRWESRKLKFASSFWLSNIDKHSVEGEEGVFLCNYLDVYRNDRIHPEIDFMQATASSEQIRRLSLKAGDVIITKDSESPDDIGVPSFVEEATPNLVCGYHLALLRPEKKILLGNFLFRYLQSERAKADFFVEANGITRFALGKQEIGNLLVPVPSLEEQHSIVSFLDEKTSAIDTLIADKERLIELLQEKRSALISHAVTKGLDPNAPMKDSGVEWLGEIPEHWETCRLKFLVRMVGGGTPSKENSEFWEGNIPWVSPKDMKSPRITDTEDHISEAALVSSATSLVEAGQVLLVVRSGILRNTVPVAINACSVSLNQDMKALIVRGTITPEYLFFLIKGLEPSILALCTKAMATVESIEVEDLRTLEIPLPPSKEQSRCVSLLNQETEQISSVILDLSDSVNLLKEYRSALITAAVTGQIDVREATA